MPWKFNPFTGNLDFWDRSSDSGDVKAVALKVSRIADENIERGDFVYASSNTGVALATNDDTNEKTLVLGIADSDALLGETLDIILKGVFNDALFAPFSPQETLFLDIDGAATNVKPTSGTPQVILGKTLGNSEFLVEIENPTFLI